MSVVMPILLMHLPAYQYGRGRAVWASSEYSNLPAASQIREQTAKTGAEIGLSPVARHCRASHSRCQRVVDLRLGEVGPPLGPGSDAASVQHFRRIRAVVFPNDFVVALPTTAAREVRMMERAERRSLAFRSWRLARTAG